MNNKKKRELTNEEIDENIFEMCNICSTTDCTGLIQEQKPSLNLTKNCTPSDHRFYLVMMIKSSSIFSCNKILWPVMTIRSCFNVHFLF